MSFSAITALIGVWLIALASPGPDVVQIVRVGSRQRNAGIWCALGIMVGNAIWIGASLLGLSVVIQTHQQLLSFLQLAGGLLLLWMGINAVRGGWKNIRQRSENPAEDESEIPAAPMGGPWQMLRLGLLTNLANPKALLFFGAVFAQFITPDMGITIKIMLALVLVAIGVAWFVGLALAVRILARFLLKHSGIMDLGAGLVFLSVAVLLFFEGIPGLLKRYAPAG